MTGQPLVVDGTPVRRPPAKAAGGSSPNGGRPTPTCVARRRLVERLEEGVDNRVTVLTAPAGYGKSVLVDHWVASHRRARVACVTFQPGDDGARAAARLTAALAGLGGDPFSVTPASHGRDRAQLGDRFIGRLVDGLAAVGQAVLVLDAVARPRAVPSPLGSPRWPTSCPPTSTSS